MPKKYLNFRLAIICIAAASVGLSMVIVSTAKLMLFLCGLITALVGKSSAGPGSLASPANRVNRSYLPIAIFVVLGAFTLSLLWTTGPPSDALGSLAKYGKLLTIVLMMMLIRDRREALFALASFMGAQIFLLAGSWMLYAGVPVPWATSNMALTKFAVFSSYLDQGIMSAVLAALCWHLRGLAPGKYGQPVAIFLAIAALCNVLYVLDGRSGHVVAIAMLSLAIMWELPKKYRALIVLLPFVVAAALFFGSSKVHERSLEIVSDIHSYEDKTQVRTSSGIRLNFWIKAGQIMAQHPVIGTGIGSWSTEFNRLERSKNPAHQDVEGNSNPHQEYLLWGMQLGVPGVLLFLALLLAALRDSLGTERQFARASQSAVVALAVACLFNASIYDALIGDFFCIVIGLLLALGFHGSTLPLEPAPQPGQTE